MEGREEYMLISALMLPGFRKTETFYGFRGFSILILQLHQQGNLFMGVNDTYFSSMYWGKNHGQWLNMLDEEKRNYKTVIRTESDFL